MWHFCLLIYSTMRFWHTGSLLYSLRRRERPAIVSTPRVQMQEGQLLCAQPKVLDDPGVCRSAVLLALGAGLGVGAVLVKVENRLDRMGEVAHKLGGVDCPRVFCARASSAGKQECAGKRREHHTQGVKMRGRARVTLTHGSSGQRRGRRFGRRREPTGRTDHFDLVARERGGGGGRRKGESARAEQSFEGVERKSGAGLLGWQTGGSHRTCDRRSVCGRA